jgi:hypothetical protein
MKRVENKVTMALRASKIHFATLGDPIVPNNTRYICKWVIFEKFGGTCGTNYFGVFPASWALTLKKLKYFIHSDLLLSSGVINCLGSGTLQANPWK